MYRDISEDDCMMFEKRLSVLESTSATFIRKIWKGEKDLWLTRTQLDDLKKFLALMMYRSEYRRNQYYNDEFDEMTRLTIIKHMRHKNIAKIQDVWFDNLKWIIMTSMEDILMEYFRAAKYETMSPMEILLSYSGPIHVTELMDYADQVHKFVCIWEAQEGSEFILSEGCFDSFEGQGGISFHHFFVISPRYAIVLVLRDYMGGEGDLHKILFRKSWFEDFHVNPEVVYTKAHPLRKLTIDDFCPTDVFKYRRIVIPRDKVFLVNSIFLDARRKCVTYKSNISMYKSLRYYDKNKAKLFHMRHDYTVLKRKLFREMNRTHSS